MADQVFQRRSTVPAPTESTLYWMTRDNEALRAEIRDLLLERAGLYHQIELLQAHNQALQRGEQSTWWARHARLLAPGPRDIQAGMQAHYADERIAIEQRQIKARLRRDQQAEEMRKIEISEMDTGTLEPKRRHGD